MEMNFIDDSSKSIIVESNTVLGRHCEDEIFFIFLSSIVEYLFNAYLNCRNSKMKKCEVNN